MELSALADNYDAELLGDGAVDVTGIAYDSRAVQAGDVFFCIRGLERDGHDFLADAVTKGAVASVVERRMDVAVPQLVVDSARASMAPLAARFYGQPTKELMLIGVTGTNGKTTTTFILDSIFRQAGMKTGLIGTVEYRIGDEILPVSRTTPEAADLQQLFRRMVDEGVSAVAMEVSSHAIDLHRVDSCDFDVLVFTNLTQDHLDYHRTMEEYGAAKKAIFASGGGRAHVVNVDDELGRAIVMECGAHLTYSTERDADLVGSDIQLDASGATFEIESQTLNSRVNSPLRGAFNVYNSLAAAGAAMVAGIGAGAIATGLESVQQVPGRFESIDAGQPFAVLIDYAHTPDSLEQALAAAGRIATGRVICVFGCGGDRDAAKRPLMGHAAYVNSDVAFVTSDNPRSERPEAIIEQIVGGMGNGKGAAYEIIVDRREAIGRALSEARPGDVVLIAGKGHEAGQTFAERTVPFDDRIVAREELARICCP